MRNGATAQIRNLKNRDELSKKLAKFRFKYNTGLLVGRPAPMWATPPMVNPNEDIPFPSVQSRKIEVPKRRRSTTVVTRATVFPWQLAGVLSSIPLDACLCQTATIIIW